MSKVDVPRFEKVVMAGVGLICGSLALDMRHHRLAKTIVGYGRGERNLHLARQKGIIDEYFLNIDDFPAGVDLLVMGTPVEAIAPLTRAFLPKLSAGVIITDVGSVKGQIVRDMERLLPKDIFFVAGHPIAGSEQWGAQAARRDLFVRHRCILTPTKKTNRKALAKVATLWRQVGAEVEMMPPDIHDHVLGVISHLPHVLVYALVNALEHRPRNGIDLKKYCAGGFKDFTRIASSRPELWRDICVMNGRALGRSLGDYIKYLQKLNRWIQDGKGKLLEKEFARAYDTRAQIPES
ncbi:MAG TPA: prephenate dehydrogenase/arogenate dehydrogenase family protein [Candidatus Binatia bacterium]|nr:prephenate dehydrogenase/arogenate dehydrogenase family protein [Candidatus Binatia bacterium]